ncbi:roundabout homolog 2-like [Styela clava]
MNPNSDSGSICYSLSLKDFNSRATYCYEQHYYICEQVKTKDMQLSLSNFIVDSNTGTKEITCMASGFPLPTVKWMKGNIVITSTPLNYHSKVGQKLVFNLKQLTIADEGQYKCFASNTVGKTFYEFTRTLHVKVPSQPSITNIISSPCNSNLLVTWKPHVCGVGIEHRFQIMDPINSNNYKVFLTTPNNVSMTSYVTGLQPSTSYIIKIEPCLTTPSTCFSHYATITNATTGGLPGPVTNPSLTMTYDGSCNVSWSTETNPEYISGFKLVINSTKAIVSSYYKDDFEINELFLPSEKTSCVLPKIFNRKYNISIQAKTCAGFGPGSEAVGECVTDTNVPSILRAPTTEEKVADNGTLAISINAPDESNGPVSCLFIIVQGNIKAKCLSFIGKSRMAELSSRRLQDEYIAIALNRNSIRSNRSSINLILGNGKNTTCDASKPNHQQQTNSSDNVYEAYNKRLSNLQTYKIILVTSTSSKDTNLFKVSDELLIEKIVPDSNQNIILGVVAGGILAILFALGCLCYVRHRNNRKKCKNHEAISSISMNVSKKEKTEYVSAGTTDTQHHLNASINTYETIADNGYEEISDRAEWNPYEIAVSQYETVL